MEKHDIITYDQNITHATLVCHKEPEALDIQKII